MMKKTRRVAGAPVPPLRERVFALLTDFGKPVGVREIVRRLQDMRREAGFELADRITTWFVGDGDVARVFGSHGEYIRGETLSTEIVAGEPPADAHRAEQDLEGVRVVLAVRRTG